jgi:hypothetical protein
MDAIGGGLGVEDSRRARDGVRPAIKVITGPRIGPSAKLRFSGLEGNVGGLSLGHRMVYLVC